MNRRQIMLGIRATAVVAAAMAVLGACEDEGEPRAYTGTVTSQDIAGSWKSNCGAHLVLSLDGDAVITGFPLDYKYDLTHPTKTYSGNGDWKTWGNTTFMYLQVNGEYMQLDYVVVHHAFGFSVDVFSSKTGLDDYCNFFRH